MNKIKQKVVDEVYAATGKDVYDLIKEFEHEAIYFPNKEDPLLIFGLHPISVADGVASPWIITMEGLSPKDLLKITKPILKKWLEDWEVLVNYVDARYEESIRWAKWAGFEIHPAEPYGFLQLPFHLATIRRK